MIGLAAACGNIEPVGSSPREPDPPPPIAVVGGVNGINRVADADGNARYLGEVSNTGAVVACNIKIAINSYDVSGRLLSNPGNAQLSFGDVLGESFRFSAFTSQGYENCISPGKTAPFDIRNDFALSQVHSLTVDLPCGNPGLYEGCIADDQPFVPPAAELALEGMVTEGVTADGRVVYTGVIHNQSPIDALPAYHVKIVITAHSADGRVVDVACATMDHAICPPPQGEPLANMGLGPGDAWTFSVPVSILPSQTCSGCSSYIINHRAQ